jgi:hypothetical protein
VAIAGGIPMAMYVGLRGQSELQAELERVGRLFAPALVKPILMSAGRHLQWMAKRNIRRGPGHFIYQESAKQKHLADHVFVGSGKAEAMDIIVGADIRKVPQAHWLEFGTLPHIIRPQRARMLWVSTYRRWSKVVRHRGARRAPWFRPAIRTASRGMLDIIVRGCRELLAGYRPRNTPGISSDTTGWIG